MRKPPRPVAVKQAATVEKIVRPKLKIGAANDPYELEADKVAEEVINMPAALSDTAARDPVIRRKCRSCLQDQETVRRKAEPFTGFETNNSTNVGLQVLKSQGQPMSASERNYFEPRFATNFSDVRIHSSTQAARVAQAINARAFTLGNDIFIFIHFDDMTQGYDFFHMVF